MTDSTAIFLAQRRSAARLKAQDIAEGYFKPDDLLYVAEAGAVPAQPGLARSFGKTVAEKACDTGFEMGVQAAQELKLHEDAADRQQQRAGEADAIDRNTL